MKIRNRSYFLPAALFLTLCGCNRSVLLNASGKLTYQGKPVPSTYVMFQPEEPGKRSSQGLTDDNGNFTLTFSRTEKGVLPGRHTIILRYYVGADEELHKIPPKASNELKAIIAKYGDVTKSPLHYQVTKNGQFFDIQLQ